MTISPEGKARIAKKWRWWITEIVRLNHVANDEYHPETDFEASMRNLEEDAWMMMERRFIPAIESGKTLEEALEAVREVFPPERRKKSMTTSANRSREVTKEEWETYYPKLQSLIRENFLSYHPNASKEDLHDRMSFEEAYAANLFAAAVESGESPEGVLERMKWRYPVKESPPPTTPLNPPSQE